MKYKKAVLIKIAMAVLVFPVMAEWKEGTAMPTPRSEMPAAYLNGYIYVPGGLGGMRKFQAYEVTKDRWKTLAPLPAGRHHLMSAHYNGKIFVFGGADEAWHPTDTAWVYEPEINRWQNLAPMPEPRFAGAAVVLDNYIYVIGGNGPSGKLLRYDPLQNTWKPLASNRQRREHIGGVAFQGKLVVVGGRFRGVGELKSTEIYDVRKDQWYFGPLLNSVRAGHAAVVHKKSILAFGGEIIMRGKRETLDDSEQLDSLSGSWRRGEYLPLALHGMPIVSINQKLYVLGGSESAGAIVNRGLVFRFLE